MDSDLIARAVKPATWHDAKGLRSHAWRPDDLASVCGQTASRGNAERKPRCYYCLVALGVEVRHG